MRRRTQTHVEGQIVSKKPEKPAKHAGGRPTKYKPEYAEQARKLCLLGLTDAELAHQFDVDVSGISRWKNQYPEFQEALKDGRENADSNVSNRLYVKAMAGDTTAMIFWLKNRQRGKWTDRAEALERGNTISLPNAVNEVEIQRLLFRTDNK